MEFFEIKGGREIKQQIESEDPRLGPEDWSLTDLKRDFQRIAHALGGKHVWRLE